MYLNSLGLFIFTCQFISRATNAWRISEHYVAESDYLISGRKVGYPDQTKDVEWTVPASCIAENSSLCSGEIHDQWRRDQYDDVPATYYPYSAPVTSVICTGAIFYPVTAVHQNENETQFIKIKEIPLCYNWYIATSPDTGSNSNHVNNNYKTWILQVWVVDPQNASPEEINNTAQQPSRSSRDITMNMYKRGQRPQVLQKKKKRDQHLQILSTNYNLELGYWNIGVNIQFLYEILLIVKGKPEVAVNGCIVRDTSAVLTLPMFTNLLSPSSNNDDTVKLTGEPDGAPLLIQDPCTPSAVLLIQRDSVILTQDGFHSTLDIYMPRKFMNNNLITSSFVTGAAFMPTCLLLLIDTTVVRINKDTGRIEVVPGLLTEGVTFLKGRHHCIQATVQQEYMSHAVAWNTGSLSIHIYAGDEGSTAQFNEIHIQQGMFWALGFNNNAIVDIQDVAFDCPSEKLGIIANVSQESSSAIIVLRYNIVTQKWTNLPYWIQDGENGDYTMLFISGAESAFLFWSSHQLHYSYQDGIDVGTMEVHHCNTSWLGESDVIQQVIISIFGDIVILMHPSNTLYYSRIGQYRLIEIPAIELSGIQQMIYFDCFGRLSSIKNDSNSGKPYKQLYPMALHVAGAVYPDICKYRHFEHNSTSDVYYLDLGEELRLSSTLTYALHYFNTIQVLTSSSELIKQQIVDSYEYYQGWQTLNRTVIIESSASLNGTENYEDKKKEAIAVITIEMKPEKTDLSCELPVGMIGHISVGCPPGRHIQVRKSEECQMPSQYTIPRSALPKTNGGIPATNKAVNYSMDMGCPISSLYKDTFLPAVDLYERDIFVEEVSANFIVWEVNGRTDFSFTASMLQAGCLSTAQTWHGMQQSSDDVDEQQREHIWGPHNYQHCFFENTTAINEDLSQPYEILNKTGLNQLQWDTWRNNSIYEFRVQVIDPQYSFCHLQTAFGVRLRGLRQSHLPSTIIMRLSIGLFAVFTFSLGFMSYFIFRRKHIEEYELHALNDDDKKDEDLNKDGVDGEPPADVLNVTRRRSKLD